LAGSLHTSQLGEAFMMEGRLRLCFTMIWSRGR